MFRLVENNQFDEYCQKVGWMSGFTWRRNYLFEYDSYQQVLRDVSPTILRNVLYHLEETCQYKQQTLMEVYRYIYSHFVKFAKLFLIYFFVYFILELVELVPKKDPIPNMIQNAVFVMILVTWAIAPLFLKVLSINFHIKLSKLIEQINKEDYLKIKGIEIKFPKYNSICCMFIPCCKLCNIFCGETDYSTIQIWQYG